MSGDLPWLAGSCSHPKLNLESEQERQTDDRQANEKESELNEIVAHAQTGGSMSNSSSGTLFSQVATRWKSPR